jgi:hypothetical protein
MSCFSNILLELDLLSQTVDIQYKGRNRFKNSLGGLLTAILMLFTIAVFTYSCNIALSRLQANTSQSDTLATSNLLRVNTSETPIIFRLTDYFGFKLDNDTKLFTAIVSIYHYYYVTDPSTGLKVNELNITDLITVPCSDGYKLDSDIYRNYLSGIDLNGYYCLAPDQVFNIQGAFGGSTEDSTQMLDIAFYQCGGNNTDCYSPEEIDTRLSTYYMELFIIDSFIDHTDYLTPVKSYLKKLYIPAASSFYKVYYYFIKSIVYESDDGFLFEGKEV